MLPFLHHVNFIHLTTTSCLVTFEKFTFGRRPEKFTSYRETQVVSLI